MSIVQGDSVKVSFIVPGYKCDQYICRNIDSILDQDYTNYEIIPVLNGTWETKADVAKMLVEKYGDKIRLLQSDIGSLGGANNLGIDHSTGDIVSCLSSDLYLMPGTLRTWVDAFKEHPDCDFVYSGYKFVSDNPSEIYLSTPFNRYHLECENFIDGANPVRRKAVARWSEDLPSLIDWDYFLSVTDNGAKGYYIKEPIYYAELPKVGGLSEDSDRNWIRRRRDVQERHYIPKRDICVTSLVDPEYGIELAKIADADFRTYPGHKPHDYKLVYLHGFYCDIENRNIQRSTGVFFNHAGHKAIQWIGQDIVTLMQLRWYDVDIYTAMVLKKIQHHFCYTSKDQMILKRMGVESDLLFPPIDLNGGPQEKKDAISVSEPELMSQLQKAMPDKTFLLNDLSCGITVHYADSAPNIFKSILHGNHVITNTYLTNVYHIQGFTNVPELRKMVVHTIRGIQKDNPSVNPESVKFYMNRTRPEAFKKRLERIANKPLRMTAKSEEIARA